MKTVVVGMREVHVNHVTLEVDENMSDEDIKRLADEKFAAGEELMEFLEFSHMMDKDVWTVEEVTRDE